MKEKFIRCFILGMLLGTVSSLDQSFAAGILAFGELRGHMEPCGCDPRTDIGGIRRIGASIGRYRALYPDVVVASTGNFLTYEKAKSGTDLAIPLALEAVAPDVVLLNQLELNGLKSGHKIPKLPWVLSNLKKSRIKLEIKEVQQRGEFEFFGVLDSLDSDVLPINKDLTNHFKKITKTKASSQRVLIYAGSQKKLRDILATEFFGTVILSNPTPLGDEIGDQERKNESLLALSLTSSIQQGYIVPFGGGGLLRLHGLERVPLPKSLTELVLNPNKASSSNLLSGAGFKGESMRAAQFYHWLDLKEEEGVPEIILKITEDARSQDRNSFLVLAKSREADLANTKFAGSESCKTCHSKAFDIWNRSKHARAYQTIFDKKRHEDSFCVECHVLGLKEKGGFVSESKTPHFKNVQCENCHGPRKDHVSNPTIKTKVTAMKSCVSCHSPSHSPGFQLKEYWNRIKHD